MHATSQLKATDREKKHTMTLVITMMITGGGTPPPTPTHLKEPTYPFQLEGEKPVVIKTTFPRVSSNKLQIHREEVVMNEGVFESVHRTPFLCMRSSTSVKNILFLPGCVISEIVNEKLNK